MPRTSEISRRLRSRADAVLGAVWFMPEARTGFTELGLSPAASSLGSRSACLGRIAPAAAAALFAPINPQRVIDAVTEAWDRSDPGTLLDARLEAATRYLRGALGGEPDGLPRANEMLHPAVGGLPGEGHPVYAALRTLPWPATPIGDLWRACDMIRERRGDSHRNAWIAAGVDPIEINVLSELWRSVPLGSVGSAQMGWAGPDVDAARDRLEDRGLVEGTALSVEGHALRDEIEVATDRQERDLVEALGDDADELLDLMTPWARAVVTNGTAWWSGSGDV